MRITAPSALRRGIVRGRKHWKYSIYYTATERPYILLNTLQVFFMKPREFLLLQFSARIVYSELSRIFQNLMQPLAWWTSLPSAKSKRFKLSSPVPSMRGLSPDRFVHEPGVPGNLLQACLVLWAEFSTDDLNELHLQRNWDPYLCSLDAVSSFQVSLSPFQAYQMVSNGRDSSGIDVLNSRMLSEKMSACKDLERWPSLSPCRISFRRDFSWLLQYRNLKGVEGKGKDNLGPGGYTANWLLLNWL